MAVNDEMRNAAIVPRIARSPGDYDRVTLSRVELCFEADPLSVVDKPFGAGVKVGFMLRLSGYAGEAYIFAKFVYKAGLVGREIIYDRLHRAVCSRVWARRKSESSLRKPVGGL